MGIFDNFLKSADKEKSSVKINWVPLIDEAQLEEIIKISLAKPVLIFKHSTSCGISKMALKTFEREFDLEEAEIELYFLDLLSYRALSTAVSEKFGIAHQSPQVLVIKNGKVIYNDSHHSISVNNIKKIL